MSIQLLLKSPNQQIDDVKVECDSKWTVENLKDYLSNEYPTKPLKNQQKIIYGGRLLPDHLMLKDILTRDQDVHIMHLVCPQSAYATRPNVESSKVKEETVTPNVAGPPPLPNLFGNTINTDGLRQRAFDPQQYMSNINNFYSQTQLPQANAIPVSSMYNAYQLATLQQTYAQFMAQFIAQGQPGYPVPNPNLNVNANLAAPSPNIPNAQANFNPPAPNAQRLNNNEERVGDRFDIIDSIYVITRVTMLFIALYFYSTPGRIMLVLGVGILLCIYHIAGRRQSAQRAMAANNQNQNTRPQSDIGANSTPENRTDQSDGQSENSSESESSSAEQPTPEPAIHQPSKLEMAYVFIKTLFTSLIPEQPLPLEVN